MTNEEKQQRELQRLECELREMERSMISRLLKMRRRIERIRNYGEKKEG